MDESSQLCGGAGPAGSLRPFASRRCGRRGLSVGVAGRSRRLRREGGNVGVWTVVSWLVSGEI